MQANIVCALSFLCIVVKVKGSWVRYIKCVDIPVQVQAAWGQYSWAEGARRLFIAALQERSHARFATVSCNASMYIVQVAWGQYSWAEGACRLFIAALQERSNARFATMSEACIFVYPPATVYLETLKEPRSRIRACKRMAPTNLGALMIK